MIGGKGLRFRRHGHIDERPATDGASGQLPGLRVTHELDVEGRSIAICHGQASDVPGRQVLELEPLDLLAAKQGRELLRNQGHVKRSDIGIHRCEFHGSTSLFCFFVLWRPPKMLSR